MNPAATIRSYCVALESFPRQARTAIPPEAVGVVVVVVLVLVVVVGGTVVDVGQGGVVTITGTLGSDSLPALSMAETE